MSSFTEKRRSDTPTDMDFVLQPGEGALMFSNRLETKGGQFVMVLNREGATGGELKDLTCAQRRAWFLYQMLTETPEGRAIMDFVLDVDDRIARTGSIYDLGGVKPQGNA